MGLFKKNIKSDDDVWRGEKATAFKPSTSSGEQTIREPKKSLIGNTFTIKGEVHTDEEILINGTVRGKVFSKNKVIVGSKGKVNASIEANEVLIHGKVTGNVKGLSKVEVSSDGHLKGNILSKSVIIAEGANFKGNIDMNLEEG